MLSHVVWVVLRAFMQNQIPLVISAVSAEFSILEATLLTLAKLNTLSLWTSCKYKQPFSANPKTNSVEYPRALCAFLLPAAWSQSGHSQGSDWGWQITPEILHMHGDPSGSQMSSINSFHLCRTRWTRAVAGQSGKGGELGNQGLLSCALLHTHISFPLTPASPPSIVSVSSVGLLHFVHAADKFLSHVNCKLWWLLGVGRGRVGCKK